MKPGFALRFLGPVLALSLVACSAEPAPPGGAFDSGSTTSGSTTSGSTSGSTTSGTTFDAGSTTSGTSTSGTTTGTFPVDASADVQIICFAYCNNTSGGCGPGTPPPGTYIIGDPSSSCPDAGGSTSGSTRDGGPLGTTSGGSTSTSGGSSGTSSSGTTSGFSYGTSLSGT